MSPAPIAISTAVALDEGATLEEVERTHTLRIIRLTYGNRAEAARILGVARSTLVRWIAAEKLAGRYPADMPEPRHGRRPGGVE